MAAPADPILASTLLLSDTSQLAGSAHPEDVDDFQRTKSGHRDLDKALDGGLDRGSICCISGEANAGAPEVASAFLVSILLDHPSARVTFIDTRQSLDVRRLYGLLVAAHRSRVADGAENKALEALDRVKIMNVFDFVGLTESVAEIRNLLEGDKNRPTSGITTTTSPAVSPHPHQPTARATIDDSEDEDQDDLLDLPQSSAHPEDSALLTSDTQERSSSNATVLLKPASHHLVLVDSLTRPIAPLLKANYAHGQVLLNSFLRSLSHLTRLYDLHTIMLNDALDNQNKHRGNSRTQPERLGIFSSCNVRPALGTSFTYALDTHLLVHRIPKSTQDARAAQSGEVLDGQVQTVSVVEVLQDRYAARVGRWACFEIEESGGIACVSF